MASTATAHAHSHGARDDDHAHSHGSSDKHSHSHDDHAHAHSHGSPGELAHGHDDHAHSHSHGSPGEHDHGHGSPAGTTPNSAVKRVLLLAAAVALLFMAGEIIGGFYAGSLAILTDAAHLLSDVAAFMISLFAVWLAERRPTQVCAGSRIECAGCLTKDSLQKHTYGFHRIEAMGALLSVSE